MGIRSFRLVCLVLALIVVLHAKAREIPQPKNNSDHNQNKEVVVAPTQSTTTTLVTTNTKTIDPTVNDVPKEGDHRGDVNGDEKNFISFAGVGAAGGIGGVAGVMPIGWGGLDKGFGTIPTFGGLGGPGGGLGGGGAGLGGGGAGAGAGGGCPPSSASGGLVPIP